MLFITPSHNIHFDSQQHYYNKQLKTNQHNYKFNILIGGKKFINATCLLYLRHSSQQEHTLMEMSLQVLILNFPTRVLPSMRYYCFRFQFPVIYFLKFDQYLFTSSSSSFHHFYLGFYLSCTVRKFNFVIFSQPRCTVRLRMNWRAQEI
jgi:hypothetical protein